MKSGTDKRTLQIGAKKPVLTMKHGWLLFFGIIYITSIMLGVFAAKSKILGAINYFCLVLCFVYVLNAGFLSKKLVNKKAELLEKLKIYRNFMLLFAFLMVLVSDAILTFDHTSIVGVLTFCFVQIFHLARIIWTNKLSFILFMLDVVIVAVLWWQGAPLIYIFGFIYACMILSNLYFAWKNVLNKENDNKSIATQKRWLIALGFSLFLFCDICVLISYLSGVTNVLLSEIQPYFNFLAWVFYMPAQIMLAMSVEDMGCVKNSDSTKF